MSTKKPILKGYVVMLCLTLLSWAPSSSLAVGNDAFLKVRQPERVADVNSIAKTQWLRGQLASARQGTEVLDSLASQILRDGSLSSWQRWVQGVNMDELHRRYSQDLISHLQAMAVLFKTRREKQGFTKLQDFDFQNLIRKSDFLLALPATLESLEVCFQDVKIAEEIHQTLALYNQERQKFDRKVFTVASRK